MTQQLTSGTPTREEINNAYIELFTAVENGIDDDFFKLRERFRDIQQRKYAYEQQNPGLSATS